MTPRLLSSVLMLGLAAIFAAHAAEPVSTPEASKALVNASGAILRGSSADALAELRKVPAEAFAGEEAGIRSCMIERFEAASPPPVSTDITEPFVRDVLKLYQDYWWQALRRPDDRAALGVELETGLRGLLGPAGTMPKDLDALEDAMEAELEKHGYHAQLGTVTPLHNAMLWRTQTSREFEVPLLDGPYRVRAELLDDFATIGWSQFGSCNKVANGGWATEEALYAVLPRYKEGIEGESFQIVFLGHEGQHMADKNRFPGMTSWELEYRAKLAELVRATGALSEKRLQSFITAQGNSPDAAHPYANTRVIADLTTKLGQSPDTVSVPALQQAATELLRADSARRQAMRDATPQNASKPTAAP